VAQHPDAVIPVDRITGPILLVCGEADSLWPSCPMADQIVERLKSGHRPAATLLRYKDAGHQVFGTPVTLPVGATTSNAWLASLGGTPEGNMAARADGWPKVEAFLKAALKR